jgi:hypothetical protein
MFDNEPSYWFGFLWADGYVSLRKGHYDIYFSQTIDDKKSVEAFADFVGYDMSRTEPRIRYRKDASGIIHKYDVIEVNFRSKIMNNRLQELGFSTTKGGRNKVPNFVKEAISLAKDEAIGREIHWSQTKYGKVAHAWLMGFFNGDGSRHSGYAAIVFASSKRLLIEIKDLFEINNNVNTIREPGDEYIVFGKPTITKGYYSLTLGPEVFRRILDSHSDCMQRKRP